MHKLSVNRGALHFKTEQLNEQNFINIGNTRGEIIAYEQTQLKIKIFLERNKGKINKFGELIFTPMSKRSKFQE